MLPRWCTKSNSSIFNNRLLIKINGQNFPYPWNWFSPNQRKLMHTFTVSQLSFACEKFSREPRCREYFSPWTSPQMSLKYNYCTDDWHRDRENYSTRNSLSHKSWNKVAARIKVGLQHYVLCYLWTWSWCLHSNQILMALSTGTRMLIFFYTYM